MNKFTHNITLVFLAAITFVGCGKDVTNPIVDTTALFAAFSVEGTQVAPARILFTNRSQNGKQFAWDFGDGRKSTVYQPDPISYSNSGTYNVSLIVSDTATARADTAVATLVIAVGGPFLAEIDLQAIWWTNTEGRLWDGDSTGPDVFARLYTSDNRSIYTTYDYTNISYASFPLYWYYGRALPDERREFTLYIFDNDGESFQDTMAVFKFDEPTATPDSAMTVRTSLILRRFDQSFAEVEMVWQWL